MNKREYRLLPITAWFDETEKFHKALPLNDIVVSKMQQACWDAKFRAEILFGKKSQGSFNIGGYIKLIY